MIADEMGILRDFKEKPKQKVDGLANGAIFACSHSLLAELVVNSDVFDFSAECLPKMLGRSLVYQSCKQHIDIGSFDRLKEANKQRSLPIKGIKLEGNWYRTYKKQIKAFGL